MRKFTLVIMFSLFYLVGCAEKTVVSYETTVFNSTVEKLCYRMTFFGYRAKGEGKTKKEVHDELMEIFNRAKEE